MSFVNTVFNYVKVPKYVTSLKIARVQMVIIIKFLLSTKVFKIEFPIAVYNISPNVNDSQFVINFNITANSCSMYGK